MCRRESCWEVECWRKKCGVLVTGGVGFIGGHVVDGLVRLSGVVSVLLFVEMLDFMFDVNVDGLSGLFWLCVDGGLSLGLV
jgi:hypothetical protein